MRKVCFRAITPSEFQRYCDWSVQNYAQSMFREGQSESMEAAMEAAQRDFQSLLPDGLDTAQNELMAIRGECGEDVGMIWYEITNPQRAFIADFVIMPQCRRRGYGLAALQALAHELAERGFSQILLHVFQGNEAARSLYEKAGFAAVQAEDVEAGSCYMIKNL